MHKCESLNILHCSLLDGMECIALLGTIRGFFRYFRTNKPKGGRTIARTNLTKNENLFLQDANKVQSRMYKLSKNSSRSTPTSPSRGRGSSREGGLGGGEPQCTCMTHEQLQKIRSQSASGEKSGTARHAHQNTTTLNFRVNNICRGVECNGLKHNCCLLLKGFL